MAITKKAKRKKAEEEVPIAERPYTPSREEIRIADAFDLVGGLSDMSGNEPYSFGDTFIVLQLADYVAAHGILALDTDSHVELLKQFEAFDQWLPRFQQARRELESCGFMDLARQKRNEQLKRERAEAEARQKQEDEEDLREYERLKAKFEGRK